MLKEIIDFNGDRFQSICFWKPNKEHGFLSNWYPSPFKIPLHRIPDKPAEYINFNCAEQFFMWRKAIVFNDDAIAEQILNTPYYPKRYKELGKEVANFTEEIWDEYKEETMEFALWYKFTCGEPTLKRDLLETWGSYLIEASPYDTVWGVGLSADDDDITHQERWKGKNLLGKALMNVRKRIMDEEIEKAEKVEDIFNDAEKSHIKFDFSDVVKTWDKVEKEYRDKYCIHVDEAKTADSDYNPLADTNALTFAIDFDGTLCENKYPEIGEPKYEIINKCRELKRQGHKLILNTCRTDTLLKNAIKWCENFGLSFDSVNENLIERINLFGNDSRKIGADYYVDDRNMSLDDFCNFGAKEKIVCPICGKEMNESYLGRQYCDSCRIKYFGNNDD